MYVFMHIYVYAYIHMYVSIYAFMCFCVCILGCNNGGGSGNFFKSKAISCKVDRNTQTFILRFFAARVELYKLRTLFLRHI